MSQFLFFSGSKFSFKEIIPGNYRIKLSENRDRSPICWNEKKFEVQIYENVDSHKIEQTGFVVDISSSHGVAVTIDKRRKVQISSGEQERKTFSR